MMFVAQILQSWVVTMIYIGAFSLLFWVLSRVWPCNPGQAKPTPRELVVDACYWLLLPLASRYLRLGLLVAAAMIVSGGDTLGDAQEFFKEGYGPLGGLNLALQAVLVLMVQDIYLYWVHRLQHGPELWKFHSIHHATEKLDWYSNSRFHPINSMISFMMSDVIVLCMGFSPQSIAVMAPANALYSALVHANLRWDFGPFKYVLASPVFHRWHHTAPKHGGMKNFAPTFPVLDVLFGTFYMPKGRLPETYGVHDPVPESFLGQLLYPFLPPRPAPAALATATNGSDDKSLPPTAR